MIPWSKIQKSFHPNNCREIAEERESSKLQRAFLQIPGDRTSLQIWKICDSENRNVIGNNQKNFHFFERSRRSSRWGVECHDNSGNVTCFTDPFILFSLLLLSLPYRKLSMGFHYNRQLSDELCSNWNRNDCTVLKAGEDLETKEWVKKSSKFCIVWQWSNWNSVY